MTVSITPITLNHQVLEESFDLVSKLSENTNWDQSSDNVICLLPRDSYKKHNICTHLAIHFNLKDTYHMKLQGYCGGKVPSYLITRLGINCEKPEFIILDALFNFCGAPYHPFLLKPWRTRPEIVWKRMMMIDVVKRKNEFLDLYFEHCKKSINIIDHYEKFRKILKFNSKHPKFN